MSFSKNSDFSVIFSASKQTINQETHFFFSTPLLFEKEVTIQHFPRGQIRRTESISAKSGPAF